MEISSDPFARTESGDRAGAADPTKATARDGAIDRERPDLAPSGARTGTGTGTGAMAVAGVIVADDLTGAADACAMFVASGCSGTIVFDRFDFDRLDVDRLDVDRPEANAATFEPATPERRASDSGTSDRTTTLDRAASDLTTFDDQQTPGGEARSGDASGAEISDTATVAGEAQAREHRSRVLPVSRRAQWLAISADTRAQSAALAADRVREIVRRVRQTSAPLRMFQKIDSTMRGHVGAEVAAAMEAWDVRLAIVTPAFPAMGRTVEDGMLRVQGPGAPPSVHVAARLEAQGLGPCQRIARPADVNAFTASSRWYEAMTAAVRAGARVLVCDAASDADLDAIVAAGERLEGPLLWVGSAGLAGALARATSGARRPDDADPSATDSGSAHRPQFGAIVFLIGSDHPVTVGQQRYLLHGPAAAAIEISAVRDVDSIAARLDRGAHVFVDIGPTEPTEAIARLVHAIADRAAGGLVLSGGDTAARICRLLEATQLRLGGEVRRGIPWGWLFTRGGQHWPVVLKSGGFGDERALDDVLAFLARREEAHD